METEGMKKKIKGEDVRKIKKSEIEIAKRRKKTTQEKWKGTKGKRREKKVEKHSLENTEGKNSSGKKPKIR